MVANKGVKWNKPSTVGHFYVHATLSLLSSFIVLSAVFSRYDRSDPQVFEEERNISISETVLM